MITTSSFEDIPILDFNDQFFSKQKLLRDLRDAVVNVGFLYIKNTGFPEEHIQDLKYLLPALFKISDQEKEQIELENSPHFLGYSAIGQETTAGVQDQREQFEFVSSQANKWQPGRPLWERLTGPNQYPSSLPDSKEIIETYMQ